MKKLHYTLFVTLVSILAGSSVSWAAEENETHLTLKEIHCEGCAKKIVTKLKAVKGVARVGINVEAKLVAVMPKADVQLSPLALWSCVENAGYSIVKLEGPSGTFTKKPKF